MANVLKNPQQELGGGCRVPIYRARLMPLLTLPTLSEFRHGLSVCLRCATDARFNATQSPGLRLLRRVLDKSGRYSRVPIYRAGHVGALCLS